MLVYGEVETPRDAAAFQAQISATLAALLEQPPGLDRHACLAGAFVDAADLVCALIDRDCPHDLAPTATTGLAALTALAHSLDTSWRSGYADLADLPTAIARFAALPCSGDIRTKPTEGYAFYALYPESYAEAARASGLTPATRVIGIRSIGAGLAAVVAAALGAADPLTVRPVGHPFDRHIEPGPQLAAAILAGNPPAIAVIDEGPGLSGSSYLGVAAWLTDHGVPRDRIHFFPSHPSDPGAEAGEQRLTLWRDAPKHLADVDRTIAAERLPHWLADCVGPLTAPLRDLFAGQWQAVTGSTAPVAPYAERRKYLAETTDGRWLVKFAGIGAIGDRKLALAKKLHANGFGPETAGLAHGFLVQRWIDAPDLGQITLPTDAVLLQFAAYLAFRATLSAPVEAGATPDTLMRMATYNTGQALGGGAGAAMRARLVASQPTGPLRRVWVDCRMHPWEWLVADERLIKTDALDHAVAHDFIGAQPIEWDLAGTIVEHNLTPLTAERLIAAFQAAARQPVDRQLLEFLTGCYLAFQLGAWTMLGAEGCLAPQLYRDRLSAWLGL